jgi:hypothetical protein
MVRMKTKSSHYIFATLVIASCIALSVGLYEFTCGSPSTRSSTNSEPADDDANLTMQNTIAVDTNVIENTESVDGIEILDDLRRQEEQSRATRTTPWNDAQKKKLLDIRDLTKNSDIPKVILDTALPALNYFDLTDKATIYPNSTRVSKLWSEGKIEVLENTARKRLQVDKLDLVAHVILLELALRNRDIDSVTANMENILARLAKPKPSLSVVAPSLIMVIRLRADRLLNITSDKWNKPIESENEFYRLGNCPMEPYLILLERSGYFESFE